MPDLVKGLTEKVEKLEYAKESVRWLLDNPEGMVDMRGIAYWAGEVERLRSEIKKAL